MGKRCLTLVLALLQVLSLSACTGQPDITTPLSGIGEGKRRSIAAVGTV